MHCLISSDERCIKSYQARVINHNNNKKSGERQTLGFLDFFLLLGLLRSLFFNVNWLSLATPEEKERDEERSKIVAEVFYGANKYGCVKRSTNVTV